MDLRNATRPKGTVTSKVATNEEAARIADTPVYNDDGTLASAPDGIMSNAVLAQYWDYLKDNDITKTDLRSILEALVSTGNVAWDFKLFEKIPVKFRVRPSWVDDCIIQKIDELTAKNDKVSAIRYNNLVAEMNIAASLMQFGENKFDVTDEASLDKSIEFVKRMSYIFRNQLVRKLAVFDRAVAVATSDWALKNFTTPLTDE